MRDLLHLRAIAYLRLGETENCLANHGQHSCVFPLRADGVHTLPRGAEGAVRDLTTLLAGDPKDDLARWLLNVAYMQLGKYPAGVPRAYLLPPKLFASEEEQPEWTDMAALAGMDLTTRSGGLVVEDMDGDGLLDVVTSTSNPLGAMHLLNNPEAKEHYPTQLFHNNGDGTFTDVARQVGLAEQGYVKGVAWGDYNNDGRPDLYVSVREGQNRLYRNDGPGKGGADAAHWKFTDVTAEAGIGGVHHTFATWFFDYDNDGWPDLFAAGYYAGSMQDVGHFEAGHTADAEMPHLFHNNHDGTFTDVAPALHLNRAMLTMGANFGDLDNDGWLDVYLGTGEPSYEALLPNRIFRNAGGKRFDDVTTATGLGHLQKGHAIAFADVENRGVEDIFELMGGAFPGDAYQSMLYRNPLPDPGPGSATNHSITLRLQGVRTNRAGYGTRIEVLFTERDANGRAVHRQVFRTVGAVSSFGGSPMLQHIGIGRATAVDEVRLRWLSSYPREQVLRALRADAAYTIVEDDAVAHPLQQRRFHLGDTLAAPAHHHMAGQ